MDTIDRIDILNNPKKYVNPFKKEWENCSLTNCYAYAFGIDVPSIPLDYNKMIKYSPGFFGGIMLQTPFNEEQLLAALLCDIDALQLISELCDPNYLLKAKEWKIAIFGKMSEKLKLYNDFHFLRQTQNGIWTHKPGFNSTPTNLDGNGNKIVDPTNCNVEYYDEDYGELLKYEYIKTIVLKRNY